MRNFPKFPSARAYLGHRWKGLGGIARQSGKSEYRCLANATRVHQCRERLALLGADSGCAGAVDCMETNLSFGGAGPEERSNRIRITGIVDECSKNMGGDF